MWDSLLDYGVIRDPATARTMRALGCHILTVSRGSSGVLFGDHDMEMTRMVRFLRSRDDPPGPVFEI